MVMDKWLTPSLVVVIAVLLSAWMSLLLTEQQTSWDKLAIDSITYYFVYMRGKNDKDQ
jgi:hypothetical protein